MTRDEALTRAAAIGTQSRPVFVRELGLGDWCYGEAPCGYYNSTEMQVPPPVAAPVAQKRKRRAVRWREAAE